MPLSAVLHDERYRAVARMEYPLRRWMDVGAGYQYERRSSNSDQLSYTRNTVFIDIKLSL